MSYCGSYASLEVSIMSRRSIGIASSNIVVSSRSGIGSEWLVEGVGLMRIMVMIIATIISQLFAVVVVDFKWNILITALTIVISLL